MIEDTQGLQNLESILAECEGCMIGRTGSLEPERVALVQNFCVTKTNIGGKVQFPADAHCHTGLVHWGAAREDLGHGCICLTVPLCHLYSVLASVCSPPAWQDRDKSSSSLH